MLDSRSAVVADSRYKEDDFDLAVTEWYGTNGRNELGLFLFDPRGESVNGIVHIGCPNESFDVLIQPRAQSARTVSGHLGAPDDCSVQGFGFLRRYLGEGNDQDQNDQDYVFHVDAMSKSVTMR